MKTKGQMIAKRIRNAVECENGHEFYEAECLGCNPAEKQVGHTPGPWKVGMEFHQKGRVILSGNDPVCKLFVDNNEQRRKANARLIAAAPEPLNALEPFSKIPDSAIWALFNSKEFSGNEVVEFRDAIRKAKSVFEKVTGK